jgi:hypothetical protein
MATQLIQLTQRQLQNDKSKSFGEGLKRGRIFALKTILEQTEPEVAFEAVTQFMNSARWKVQAYDREQTQSKTNGSAKG